MPPTPATVAAITFAWPGYLPETAIRPYESTEIDAFIPREDIDVPPPEGETLGDVYNWMRDHDLRIYSASKLRSGSRPGARRWEAVYCVVFAH